jgi:hypothetical protein
MGTGCKVLAIIGAILAAILIVGVIVSYVYCEKIQVMAFGSMVDTIERQVAKDLPDDYKLDDVKSAFKDFKDYLSSGAIKDKIKSPEFQNFSTQVMEALKDKKIDKDELDKLLETMKKIVGK